MQIFQRSMTVGSNSYGPPDQLLRSKRGTTCYQGCPLIALGYTMQSFV